MWIPGNEKTKVPSTTNLQSFYLFMAKQTQEFGAPKINVSSTESVHYQVYGSAKDGGVLTDAFQTLLIRTIVIMPLNALFLLTLFYFFLEYTCNKVGSTVFNVTIDVPPYAPVVFSWRKLCGTPPPSLTVGTLPNLTDVVDNGVTSMLYVRVRTFPRQLYFLGSFR